MILRWMPVTTASGRMRVGISIVLVPNGSDIARVGFEKEFWHREEPLRRTTAHETWLIVRGMFDGQFSLEHCATFPTSKIVLWHYSRSAALHLEQSPQIAR